jgi:hypothetical protein
MIFTNCQESNSEYTIIEWTSLARKKYFTAVDTIPTKLKSMDDKIILTKEF